MKLVQVLFINVATVAVALVVYDRLRGKESGPSHRRTSMPRSHIPDTAALEVRLAALEAERRPSLWAAGTDSRVFERPDAPEETERDHAPAAEQTPDETRPAKKEPRASMASRDIPTTDEVRKFRQLREAARRQDAVERNKARVDKALDKLSLHLTKRQRTRIHTAFAAFEPRVKVIWTEVKTQAQETIAAGGDVDRGEIVSSTTAVIQQEFAKTLTDIVDNPPDAETIAKTLMPGGR